jgi:hypothetical protein
MCQEYSTTPENVVCCPVGRTPVNGFAFVPDCSSYDYTIYTMSLSYVAIGFELIGIIFVFMLWCEKKADKNDNGEKSQLIGKNKDKKSEDDPITKNNNVAMMGYLAFIITILCAIADEFMVIFSFRYKLESQILLCLWYASVFVSANQIILNAPILKKKDGDYKAEAILNASYFNSVSRWYILLSTILVGGIVVLLLPEIPLVPWHRDLFVYTYIFLTIIFNHSILTKKRLNDEKKRPNDKKFLMTDGLEWGLFLIELFYISAILLLLFYSVTKMYLLRDILFTLMKLVYITSLVAVLKSSY